MSNVSVWRAFVFKRSSSEVSAVYKYLEYYGTHWTSRKEEAAFHSNYSSSFLWLAFTLLEDVLISQISCCSYAEFSFAECFLTVCGFYRDGCMFKSCLGTFSVPQTGNQRCQNYCMAGFQPLAPDFHFLKPGVLRPWWVHLPSLSHHRAH